MVDNEEEDNRITCEGSIGEAACWVFVPTANAQCYYVRNLQTGRYIQGYAKESGTAVSMGTTRVEYHVASQATEGGRYGFACTTVTPHDFSSGTIGLNLRAESNQAGCLVQTYAAAAGTNHRSFWTLEEVPDEIATGISATAVPTAVDVPYDLLGRPASRHAPGILVRQGRKYIRR